MKFVSLTEEEFRVFAKEHPLKSFIQTPEMAKLKQDQGWNIHYVGVKKNQQILAATLMMSNGNFLGKKMFYAPNGFLIDYQNTNLLSFFTKEIKHYIYKHKGYTLIIDPYLPLLERDINGDVVEHGFDNRPIISRLEALGYHYHGTSSQVKYMFALDTANKKEEEILKEMRPNTRNLIRKTLKPGFIIRELSYDEIEIFKQLTEETSDRKNFSDKPLRYYQKMYELFHDRNELKYMIAEIHFDQYIGGIENELKEEQLRYQKISDKSIGKKKEAENRMYLLEERKKEALSLQKEVGNVLVLSGGMFMLYGDEIVYLFSGNYKKYMQFNAQYRIQWEMIQYAIRHGYPRYNFYGIISTDKNHPEYGIYEFKKGFNGYVIELIGEFELKITWFYHLRKLIKKLTNR